MAIENVQELMLEQLGKRKADVFSSASGAITGKDYYCLHFPVESVIGHIGANNVPSTGGSEVQKLELTMPAGTTIFLNVTEITVTSGVVICYYESAVA